MKFKLSWSSRLWLAWQVLRSVPIRIDVNWSTTSADRVVVEFVRTRALSARLSKGTR